MIFAGLNFKLRHASNRRAGNRVQRLLHAAVTLLCSDLIPCVSSSDELGRPDTLALVELVANLAGARRELARACEILARGVHLARVRVWVRVGVRVGVRAGVRVGVGVGVGVRG